MAVERAPDGHIIPREKKSYNERLFGSGWRRRLHESRYLWLNQKMQELELQEPSILELGCFDAKTIDYLPFGFSNYLGYDANWENGLAAGRERWRHDERVTLIESHCITDFNPGHQTFDCSIALETLEHLAPGELEEYLLRLQAATRQYLFVSVPYEQGLPLLLKYLYKSARFKVDEPYSLKELAMAVAGKPGAVPRLAHGHKGFDYRDLVNHISNYFDLVSISGLPFTHLPLSLNFSVAIVAKTRN